MNIPAHIKERIDRMTYEEMLREWRFAPAGAPLFQGEVGDYFAARMKELRRQPGGAQRHVQASKNIGWD